MSLVRILRVLFGFLPLVALGRQLAIHRGLGFSVTNFFSYFTNLSNLFAGGVLLLCAAASARDNSSSRTLAGLRAVAVINMVLVGIVFTVLLRDTDLGSLLRWVNTVLHDLMPCILMLDWVALPPAVRLGWRELMMGLLFPVAYVIYVLVRGRITGWYPYPFLNPAQAGGAAGVLSYVVGITVTFVLVGGGLIALGNWRRAAVARWSPWRAR
jgi:hypothetical protein